MTVLFIILYRWGGESDWKTNYGCEDYAWKSDAEKVMRSYTDETDYSFIEQKDSALVWNYHDAEPYFGSQQANKMLDDLRSKLANMPVVVKKGKHIVEVKLQVHTYLSSPSLKSII